MLTGDRLRVMSEAHLMLALDAEDILFARIGADWNGQAEDYSRVGQAIREALDKAGQSARPMGLAKAEVGLCSRSLVKV